MLLSAPLESTPGPTPVRLRSRRRREPDQSIRFGRSGTGGYRCSFSMFGLQPSRCFRWTRRVRSLLAPQESSRTVAVWLHRSSHVRCAGTLVGSRDPGRAHPHTWLSPARHRHPLRCLRRRFHPRSKKTRSVGVEGPRTSRVSALNGPAPSLSAGSNEAQRAKPSAVALLAANGSSSGRAPCTAPLAIPGAGGGTRSFPAVPTQGGPPAEAASDDG